MSTFLELAQRLKQESGTGTTGLTTTVGQTGENKKIVAWILTAYEDIQNLHTDWNFLRFDLSFSTISGTNNYTKAAISLDEYGEWMKENFRSYLTSSGASSEQYMHWMDWEEFRDAYVFGSNRTLTGFPRYISQKPDTSLIVYPIPDATYTVNGEYFKRAQTMTTNSETSLIPVKYDMIIMWRALMFYAAQSNAPELYATGEREYKRILLMLESSQLPPIRLAGSLV